MEFPVGLTGAPPANSRWCCALLNTKAGGGIVEAARAVVTPDVVLRASGAIVMPRSDRLAVTEVLRTGAANSGCRYRRCRGYTWKELSYDHQFIGQGSRQKLRGTSSARFLRYALLLEEPYRGIRKNKRVRQVYSGADADDSGRV